MQFHGIEFTDPRRKPHVNCEQWLTNQPAQLEVENKENPHPNANKSINRCSSSLMFRENAH